MNNDSVESCFMSSRGRLDQKVDSRIAGELAINEAAIDTRIKVVTMDDMSQVTANGYTENGDKMFFWIKLF